MRMNPYLLAHKPARFLLYDGARHLGRCDYGDDLDSRTTVHALRAAIVYLRSHGKLEDRLIHPFLAARAPRVVSELASEHADLDARLEKLSAQVEAFADATADRRRELGDSLQVAWNEHAARYGQHLAHEETNAVAALHECFTDAELMGLLEKAHNAVGPLEGMAFMPAFLLSLNVEEIAQMYQGMRASAPPPVVQGYERAAAAILQERWELVKRRAAAMRR